MITAGSPEVTILEDDWTVVTLDGSASAHWEHTVALTPTGPVVLPAPDAGAVRLAALGVAMLFWAMQYADCVKIVSPQSLQRRVCDFLRQSMQQYEEASE